MKIYVDPPAEQLQAWRDAFDQEDANKGASSAGGIRLLLDPAGNPDSVCLPVIWLEQLAYDTVHMGKQLNCDARNERAKAMIAALKALARTPVDGEPT